MTRTHRPPLLSPHLALLFLLLQFLLPSPAPAATAQDPARTSPAPRATTLATYNAKWMLDAFDDPYTADEEFEPKPKEALAALARVVRSLDADVVALQEVENEGLLRSFVAEHLSDSGYRFVVAPPTNSGRGQNVGLLSRLPVRSVTSHRFRPLRLDGEPGREWRFARDLLRVELETPAGRPLVVFVAHLKSQRSDGGDERSERWRLAEAREARRVVEAELARDPRAWVAVLGDLNDRPGSAPVEALLGAGLSDVHAALPPDRRVTYLEEPYRGTIDYVLASPALARRLVPGTARTLDGDGLLAASDHAPVAAAFSLEGGEGKER